MWWTNDYGDKVSFNFTVPAHNATLRAVWLCTHIASAEEFVIFSWAVNSGKSYSGTAVFLDADIDLSGGFSEQFEPIKNNFVHYFSGTFDGQGYTISNLAVNSSSECVGLFGYSWASTIRNVVLDSSCSVVSSYSGSVPTYVGGIIGCCQTLDELCEIENTVSMASISFSGNTKYSLYLGGSLDTSMLQFMKLL